MAGALLVPASLAMITATFTGIARGNAIGQWTSWSGISFIIGPTLGGWLVDVSTWRLIFLINIPIALVTLLLLVRLGGMHQARREDLRVDVPGAILCTAGLGLLVAGFIEQPQLGWGDPLIVGAFVGGLACLGAFVAYELRTPMPMLPLRLFRLRNFSVTNIETLSVYGGLSGLSTFLTLYLIEFAGYSALQAGISLLPITLVMFFLSPRMGRLSMQHGPRLFMALRADSRGRLRARLHAPATRRGLLGRHRPGAARLLGRAVPDRRAADDDGARGRRSRRRGGRVGREQRGGSHRGPPRDRDPRDPGRRRRRPPHRARLPRDDGRGRRAARLRRPDRRDRDPESVSLGIAYVVCSPWPKRAYTATEAARELGISVDTLRRWDREGRIRTERDSANRRLVSFEEIERLRGDGPQHMSARNRLRGTVSEVRVEGLLAQVELTVTEPARVVAVVTRDAVEELGLKPGMAATAVVKSTSVMVEA